ncbi:MAG: glycosyltransferase family 39 protein [Proteobacteria bacterium]|nr:glycosyltransferase family 39 protein [Pseudomonadota bacterium]
MSQLLDALADGKRARTVVLAFLALYAVSFAVFYPSVITVADEGSYVRQANLILAGSDTVEKIHPFTGEVIDYKPINDYPLGTALLLVPFVAVGGWQAAFVVPMLCLLFGVWITARWLEEEGHSPLFALFVLAYPPALVFGRIAMSDAPSLLVAAAGLWLFWRGQDRPAPTWLAAGFVAGVSLLFRESNALVFAPFFVGAVLRGESKSWALVVGGLLGVGARMLAGQLFFGDAFFAKRPESFSLSLVAGNLPLQALALLVLVPGGLLAGFAYRGRRWPELVATVAIFPAFYALYEYSAAESALWKRLVLGPRYFLPLLPLSWPWDSPMCSRARGTGCGGAQATGVCSSLEWDRSRSGCGSRESPSQSWS